MYVCVLLLPFIKIKNGSDTGYNNDYNTYT